MCVHTSKIYVKHFFYSKSFLIFLSMQLMWVYDEDVGMNCREVTFVPGLYKIFDEILGEYLLKI